LNEHKHLSRTKRRQTSTLVDYKLLFVDIAYLLTAKRKYLMSALAMLRELNPQKGDYIIQTTAASTLGRMIIQVARHFGFKVGT
jgi:hypothetical protein